MGCRAAAVLLVVASGCNAVLGIDSPQLAHDASSTPPGGDTMDAPLPVDGATGYRARSVRFDGTTYLSNGKLLGVADGPRGTFSVWLHFNAGDGQQQLITAAQIVGVGGIARQSNNHVQLVLPACTGATLLDMTSLNTYTSTSGWIHVLASWDLTIGRAQLYINDLPDRSAQATTNGGNICYTAPAWGIGGMNSATLAADVADLYASLDTSIDLDIVANRRMFISATGKPVDLGTRCSTPLGTAPAGCFFGTASSWNSNKGTGAGFAVHGDPLTAAPTSPSD